MAQIFLGALKEKGILLEITRAEAPIPDQCRFRLSFSTSEAQWANHVRVLASGMMWILQARMNPGEVSHFNHDGAARKEFSVSSGADQAEPIQTSLIEMAKSMGFLQKP